MNLAIGPPARRWVAIQQSLALAATGNLLLQNVRLPATLVDNPFLPVVGEGPVAHGVDALPVTCLPLQEIGKSNEHISLPGRLTLARNVVIRGWIDIGESAAGFIALMRDPAARIEDGGTAS